MKEHPFNRKVLIVASYNEQRFYPFITEQVEALQSLGIEVEYFGIIGKGILGYLRNRKALIQKIHAFQPSIIHAHYSLSGLLANLQRQVPVITTYHGSDINNPKVLPLSRITMYLSSLNIFVSQRNVEIAGIRSKYILLPCGVTFETFSPRTKEQAREALGWDYNAKKVLFAGAFADTVKNAPLAQEAMKLLPDVELVELSGYTREQVANLFYAADVLLMTSFTEGSPQVIKEAMACGCPIVSVDVGDVAERTAGLDGCYITSRDPKEVALALRKALESNRTQGRERLIAMGLDNRNVAEQLIGRYIYQSL